FALEVDFRAAAEFGQALGEIQRVRATDVIALEVGQLLKEFRVGLGGFVFAVQVENQRHQGFCNVAATEGAEQAVCIWASAEFGRGPGPSRSLSEYGSRIGNEHTLTSASPDEDR